MHVDVRLKEFASLGVWGSSFETLGANLNPNSCCCTCYCGLIMIYCNNRAKEHRYLPRSSNAASVARLAEDNEIVNMLCLCPIEQAQTSGFTVEELKWQRHPIKCFSRFGAVSWSPHLANQNSGDWLCEFKNKKREIESTKHQQLYSFTFPPTCNSFWPRIFQWELWGPPGNGIKGATQWNPHIAALQLHIRMFYEC